MTAGIEHNVPNSALIILYLREKKDDDGLPLISRISQNTNPKRSFDFAQDDNNSLPLIEQIYVNTTISLLSNFFYIAKLPCHPSS